MKVLRGMWKDWSMQMGGWGYCLGFERVDVCPEVKQCYNGMASVVDYSFMTVVCN